MRKLTLKMCNLQIRKRSLNRPRMLVSGVEGRLAPLGPIGNIRKGRREGGLINYFKLVLFFISLGS